MAGPLTGFGVWGLAFFRLSTLFRHKFSNGKISYGLDLGNRAILPRFRPICCLKIAHSLQKQTKEANPHPFPKWTDGLFPLIISPPYASLALEYVRPAVQICPPRIINKQKAGSRIFFSHPLFAFVRLVIFTSTHSSIPCRLERQEPSAP